MARPLRSISSRTPSHLKAIGHTPEGHPLLDKAGVTPDDRVVAIGKDVGPFVRVAAGRQWDREASVRILA